MCIKPFVARANRCLFWLQLTVLKWRAQPKSAYDLVHLVLPFMSCEQPDLQRKLAQGAENILLTQALVYDLLQYDPVILAVASCACSCELVAGKPLEDLQVLPRLAKLVCVDEVRTLECIQAFRSQVDLDSLRPQLQHDVSM